LKFALTLKPVAPLGRLLRMARWAEQIGFESLWLYDVPLAWMDPLPLLAAIAAHTSRLRLGVCVANPVTRAPLEMALASHTLHAMSGGRFELGLSRGDGAARWLARQPATLDEVRDAIHTLRTSAPSWSIGPPAVWLGTYGPRGLALAGEAADGVILQFADRELTAWARACTGPEVRAMAAAAVALDVDKARARQRVRWFVRMISEDLARIVPRVASLPAELQEWAAAWKSADAPRRDMLCDRMADRFALVGPASACRKRLAALEAAGVECFNYFVLDDDDDVVMATGHMLLDC